MSNTPTVLLDPSTCQKTVSFPLLERLLFHMERNGGRTLQELSSYQGLLDFFRENPDCCKDVETTMQWVEHMMNSATWEKALRTLTES